MRNAKKILSIITAGMLLFCGACDETGTTDGGKKPAPAPEAEHVHEWLLIEENKATCTHDGYEKFECECGEIEEKTHEKLEHTYAKTETIRATCINSGSVTYACECGASYIETSPMLDHEWVEINETPATCTAQGIEQYECELCGGTKTITLPMVDHEWELISSTEPTCNTGGVDEYKCSSCGQGKTVTIPAYTHSLSVSTIIAPTCTADGLLKYECTHCGETKETVLSGEHWHDYQFSSSGTHPDGDRKIEHYRCTICDDTQTYSMALDHTHNFKEYKAVEPICILNGVYVQKCADCGCIKGASIQEKTYEHNYVLISSTEPTTPEEGTAEGCMPVWTETYKCTLCEGEYTMMLGGGHSEDRDFVRYGSCYFCGYTLAEVTKCQNCDLNNGYFVGCPLCKALYVFGYEY